MKGIGNRLKIEGLEELKAALRQLPARLTAEAGDIVLENAEEAATDIIETYPERTGNLRAGVRVTKAMAGRFGAMAVVVNKAPHAWIFELGTQARHTAIGANRGSMPPGHVFVPLVMKHRRKMYRDDFRKLLLDAGLEVSGG